MEPLSSGQECCRRPSMSLWIPAWSANDISISILKQRTRGEFHISYTLCFSRCYLWVQSQQNKKQHTKWHHSMTALGWEGAQDHPPGWWLRQQPPQRANEVTMTRTEKQPWVNQANSAWDFKAQERDVWPSRTGGECIIKVKSLLQRNSHICTRGTAASQGQEPRSHPTPISKGCVGETHTKQLCTPQAAPD